MDLKTFVENTTMEILSGIKSAQEKIHNESDGVLVPEYALNPDRGSGRLQTIDFDVAVTTADEKDISGGLKVWGLGAEGKIAENSSTISRIKFKVPVAFPYKN